jgi:biotin-(acetyl-CoA carboxylase) ligase
MLAAWRARSSTLGRRVLVGGTEGTAVDVDEDGALLVAVEDGTVRRVLTGDVATR